MDSQDDKIQPVGQIQLPEKPIEISARLAWIAFAAAIFVTGVLLCWQMSRFKVASEDACAYYLPLAREISKGHWENGQLPSIPPLYPAAMGIVARAMSWADHPVIAAGQAINIICLMLSMLFVFLIGKMLFNYRVALSAAALACVNPWLVKFTVNVGPESLYAMLLALAALLLVMFLRRPSPILSASVGVAASLAMLTRSEGIAIVFVSAIVIVAICMFRLKGRRWITAIFLLAMLAAGTATFWPRLNYVKSITGHRVSDIRLLPYVGGSGVNLRDYPSPGHDKAYVEPTDVGLELQTEQSSHDRVTAMAVISDLWEGFFMVFGPATIVFAIFWFAFRTNISANRAGQLVVGSVVLSQILIVLAAMILPLGLNEFSRRYTIPVSAIAQLWGALGLVSICEWLRVAKIPAMVAVGQRVSLQVAVLAGLIAGLAMISVFGSSVGDRHAERAYLGSHVLEKFGAGKRILSTTAQSQFYADGIFLSMRYVAAAKKDVDVANIAKLCRDRGVDFIIAGSDDEWGGSIIDGIKSGKLSGDIQVLSASSGRKKEKTISYLIDAKKLQAAAGVSVKAN